MCLCCFFNNYNQFQIRKGIQLRADRFEHYIEKYKIYFISKINDNLDKPLCDKHDNQDNKRLLELIKEIVNKNEKDIYNFFDSLQQIYIWWINSESQKAIEKLHEVLKKYKIIETMKTDMVGNVLFRGRVANYPVSHWDMFHIPFNKRYLIGNQRYSLVGQPILYLATSPYCVAKELKTINNLKISSIVKNPLTDSLGFSGTRYSKTMPIIDTQKKSTPGIVTNVEKTHKKMMIPTMTHRRFS